MCSSPSQWSPAGVGHPGRGYCVMGPQPPPAISLPCPRWGSGPWGAGYTPVPHGQHSPTSQVSKASFVLLPAPLKVQGPPPAPVSALNHRPATVRAHVTENLGNRPARGGQRQAGCKQACPSPAHPPLNTLHLKTETLFFYLSMSCKLHHIKFTFSQKGSNLAVRSQAPRRAAQFDVILHPALFFHLMLSPGLFLCSYPSRWEPRFLPAFPGCNTTSVNTSVPGCV